MRAIGLAPLLLTAQPRHNPITLLSSTSSTPLVVVLDYDGVCCDSEAELTRAAWRTALNLWPDTVAKCQAVSHLMDESAYVDRRRLGGKPLVGLGDDDIPNWLATKMRLLRPLMTSPAEALLLTRLCAEEALSDDARKRPLTVGEISANWNAELRETLCARYAISEPDACDAMAATREAWVADDFDDWASSHTQYPAVFTDLREACTKSLCTKPIVYVLAQQQDAHLAHKLLRHRGVPIEESRVLDVGRGYSTRERLNELRRMHPDATLRYVDDDVNSLLSLAEDVRLFSLEFFFASYGYSTAEQQFRAASMPRARALGDARELEAVLKPPRDDRKNLFKGPPRPRRSRRKRSRPEVDTDGDPDAPRA